LKFIGYFLPEISFEDRQFTEDLYFSNVTFYGTASFFFATLYGKADFYLATFSGQADFKSEFKDKATFNYVLFEDGKKILFETEGALIFGLLIIALRRKFERKYTR
jgi:hypothetical protein